MKTIAVALLILASVLAIHFALGASSTDRPAGVAAQDWIAVSDKLGFVVIPPDARVVVTPDKQPLLFAPAVTGYFMARNAHGWQRLVIVEPLKGPGAAG